MPKVAKTFLNRAAQGAGAGAGGGDSNKDIITPPPGLSSGNRQHPATPPRLPVRKVGLPDEIKLARPSVDTTDMSYPPEFRPKSSDQTWELYRVLEHRAECTPVRQDSVARIAEGVADMASKCKKTPSNGLGGMEAIAIMADDLREGRYGMPTGNFPLAINTFDFYMGHQYIHGKTFVTSEGKLGRRVDVQSKALGATHASSVSGKQASYDQGFFYAFPHQTEPARGLQGYVDTAVTLGDGAIIYHTTYPMHVPGPAGRVHERASADHTTNRAQSIEDVLRAAAAPSGSLGSLGNLGGGSSKNSAIQEHSV